MRSSGTTSREQPFGVRVFLRIAVAGALGLWLGGLAGCSSGEDGRPDLTPASSPSTEGPSPTGTGRASSSEPTVEPQATVSERPTASARPTTARITVVTVKLSGRATRDWTMSCWLTVNGQPKRCGPPASIDYPLQGGALSWRVPTALTRHLWLTYYDVAFEDIPDHPDAAVVMSYEGVPPGTRLTPAQAATQTSASPCWAGTTKDKATLHVRAETSPVGRSPLVYTDPTAGASGGFRPTFDGGLVSPWERPRSTDPAWGC